MNIDADDRYRMHVLPDGDVLRCDSCQADAPVFQVAMGGANYCKFCNETDLGAAIREVDHAFPGAPAERGIKLDELRGLAQSLNLIYWKTP